MSVRYVPEHLGERQVLAEKVLISLDRMPHNLRRVFILTHYKEATPEQIASEIGLERLEVELLISSANQLFRSSLRFLSGESTEISDCGS